MFQIMTKMTQVIVIWIYLNMNYFRGKISGVQLEQLLFHVRLNFDFHTYHIDILKSRTLQVQVESSE